MPDLRRERDKSEQLTIDGIWRIILKEAMTDKDKPKDLRPVLAVVTCQTDLGEQRWYEVVYYNEDGWQSFEGSNTFEHGEQVEQWVYAHRALSRQPMDTTDFVRRHVRVANNPNGDVLLVYTNREGEDGYWRGKHIAKCRNTRIAEVLCDLWNDDPIRHVDRPPGQYPAQFDGEEMEQK